MAKLKGYTAGWRYRKLKHSMKKIFPLVLAMLVLIQLFITEPLTANAAESLDIGAESAILVDAETGKVLYAKTLMLRFHRQV